MGDVKVGRKRKISEKPDNKRIRDVQTKPASALNKQIAERYRSYLALSVDMLSEGLLCVNEVLNFPEWIAFRKERERMVALDQLSPSEKLRESEGTF
jgi:hypothetical protein